MISANHPIYSLIFCDAMNVFELFFSSPNNNMISNSLAPEEEFLFSSPESLEQLRQDLLALAQQDHISLQMLQVDLQTLLNAPNEMPIPHEILKQVDFQLKERSACVVTLAQLAVRMVECIRDQQHQHLQLLERYEHQVDTLREQNDCLTHRNKHIETDIEYFREHLQAAENQLESIAALQEDAQRELSEVEELQKDQQIEQLQAEVERIRAELQFYKFSTASRKSAHNIHHPPPHPLLPIRSHEYLRIEERFHHDDQLATLHQTVQRLAAQNQILRREINASSHNASKRSLHLPTSIREELIEETQRNPIDPVQLQLQSQPEFSTIIPCISRFDKEHLLRDTSKSLESPRSRFEREQSNLCQTPSVLQNLRAHVLSSEWSTKSFDNFEHKPARLVFLHEEDDEKHKHSSKRIQQTKQTEESVREAECKQQKVMTDVGVNTDATLTTPQIKSAPSPAQSQPSHKPFFQKILQVDVPFLRQFSSFLVERRIKRSILRANQSLLLMPC